MSLGPSWPCSSAFYKASPYWCATGRGSLSHRTHGTACDCSRPSLRPVRAGSRGQQTNTFSKQTRAEHNRTRISAKPTPQCWAAAGPPALGSPGRAMAAEHMMAARGWVQSKCKTLRDGVSVFYFIFKSSTLKTSLPVITIKASLFFLRAVPMLLELSHCTILVPLY